MWSSPKFLDTCQKLKDAGLKFELEPGLRIARGFADLGTEEFYVVGPQKIASIFTGQVSQILPDHVGHFFWVPSVQEFFSIFDALGFELLELNNPDKRVWFVKLKESKLDCIYETRHAEIGLALANALLEGLLGRKS